MKVEFLRNYWFALLPEVDIWQGIVTICWLFWGIEISRRRV